MLVSHRDGLKLTAFKHLPGRERGQGHWDLWELRGMWLLHPLRDFLWSRAPAEHSDQHSPQRDGHDSVSDTAGVIQ